jgi:polyisoprenoid-binding protein YceI
MRGTVRRTEFGVRALVCALIWSAAALAAAENWVDVPVQSQGSDKVATLPRPLKAGDCWMAQGSRYVFHPDGTGEFSASTKTDKTSTYDIWHQSAAIKDANGDWDLDGRYRRVEYGRSMDSMSMAVDGKWHAWNVTFAYDRALFGKLKVIRWVGDC